MADGPYGGFTNTRERDLMLTPYVKLNERRGALDALSLLWRELKHTL